MDKEKETKLPDINIRSDEVQEILGLIPHWIIRLGITIIAVIVLIILIGSWYFKYPDLITAPVVLSTEFPASPVVTRSSGKIEHIFITDKENVSRDDRLMVIENGSNYYDVFKLKMILPLFSDFNRQFDPAYFDSISFEQNLGLGELQFFWADLQKSFENYIHFVQNNVYDKNSKSLDEEIFDNQLKAARQFNQVEIKKKELALSEKQNERTLSLRDSGVYTDLDVEIEESKYLQQQDILQSSRTGLSNTKIEITKLKQKKTDLEYQYLEEKNSLESSIKESYEKLIGEYQSWELKYVLKSSADGIASFTSVYKKNLNVVEGTTVIYIIPEIKSELLGNVRLPIKGAGKVKSGQEVNIKFDNFPYMEYGMVSAFVKTISLVPESNVYNLDLEFPDSLHTNYGKDLVFSQSMQGTAEIITEEIPLLVRILNPLKALFKKHLN